MNGPIGTLIVAVAFATTAVCQVAVAQEQTSKLEEIVITAQKHESSIQETPLAVSAVDGSVLEKQKVSTLADLATSLPSLDVMNGGHNNAVAVRGAASIEFNGAGGNESRTAIHSDGIYISRPEFSLLQFFDVERVEYLRGPQGTLYGRNATGGAINVITRDPDPTTGGYVSASVGNYDTFGLTGAVNLPISDSLTGRLAVDYSRHDGYYKETSSGRSVYDKDAISLRGKLKYDVDDFTLKVTGSYFKQDDHDQGGSLAGGANPDVVPIGLVFGGTPGEFPNQATDAAGFPRNDRKFYGLSTEATWRDLAGGELTAVLGYQSMDMDALFDNDYTTAPVAIANVVSNSDSYSAEVRYRHAGERHDFTVGIFYFGEDLDAFVGLPLNLQMLGGPDFFVQGIISGGSLSTDAYAAFAQWRYDFTAKLYVEIGARYSYEEKSVADGVELIADQPYSPKYPLHLTSPVSGSDSWDSADPKVTLGFEPTDNLHVYASYAQAFKSGGFNLGAGAQTFEPETIDGFEVGLKYINTGRTFSANLAAFTYNYSDMQVQRVADDGLNIELVNAAKSSINGVEVESRWFPVAPLELGLTASWLDAKYDDFKTAVPYYPGSEVVQLAGNQLPQAPRNKVTISAAYTWDLAGGQLVLGGNATWRDRVYYSPFEFNPVSSPSTQFYNAYVSYDTKDWTLGAYARNIGDEQVPTFVLVHGPLFGYQMSSRPSDPRTYGVSITRRF